MIRINIISIFIALCFVIILITDFYHKCTFYFNIDGFKPLLFSTKLLIGAVLTFTLIVNRQIEKINIIYVSLLLICGIISLAIQDNSSIPVSMYLMGKYMFGIIVLIFFLSYYKDIDSKYLNKTIEYIIWLNFACILLGFVFNIHVFQTYYGGRFGYDGFFKSTSTASYFYMFSLALVLLKKHRTKTNFWLIIATIISSLLVGSKTLYAFVAFCLLILLFKKIGNRQKLMNPRTFYFFSSLVIIVVVIITLIPLLSLSETFSQVLKEDGAITAFFSYRDHLVINALKSIQENYNMANFIFGGLGYIEKLTEIALIDIFLTFGLFGVLIYIKLLAVNLPRVPDSTTNLVLLGIAIMIFLRGNFFYFPSVIYIALAIFTVILNEFHTQSKLKNS